MKLGGNVKIDELKEERRADRGATVYLLAERLKLGAGHASMLRRARAL